MCRLFVELRDRVKDGKARASRPLGVIVVRRGVAEEGHNPIADVAHDFATKACYRLRGCALIARHRCAPFLGVELSSQRRRADQVAKQNRQMPPLTGDLARLDEPGRRDGRADLRTQRSAAFAAELFTRQVGSAAFGACRRQRRTARCTELSSFAIGGPAFRTLHKSPRVAQLDNSSSSALASLRSAVSKPSVNQL